MTEVRRGELDDVDRTLIAGLIADGRATYAALAPIVGLSQAAVRSRVQRLLDENIITVTGRVDPASLGLGVFGFAFIEISLAVDDVADRLGKLDDVVFIAIGAGRFSILAELRCVDIDNYLDTLDRIRIVDGVRRVQSVTALHYEKQDWTGIGNLDAPPVDAPEVSDERILDDVDRKLVAALIADGRATYAALAGEVELSQAAVRDRVIDLLESSVLTIQATPVPEAMGIGGFAGLLVKASGPVGPLAEFVASLPESCLVVRTLGRFDLLAEVWFNDDDHLAEILDRMRAQPGMGTVDTHRYLRIALEEFAAGLHR